MVKYAAAAADDFNVFVLPNPQPQHQPHPLPRLLCRLMISSAAFGSLLAVAAPADAAAWRPHHGAIPTDATGQQYVVKTGDTLVGIARRSGAALNELLALNGMTPQSAIHPGDTLLLPGATTTVTTTTVPAPTSEGTYVIARGDYLVKIARTNGVTLSALLASNNMTATSAIQPGQILQLPKANQPVVPPVAPTPTPTTAAPSASTPMDNLVAFLRAQIGKPYAFYTAGPESYDCSGLVRAAYLQLGISLPHQSLLQSRLGTAVDWRTEDVRAGDLIFSFSTGKTYISHVGVAISATEWINASQSGVPVRIGRLPSDEKIQAVRRIVP